MLLYDRKNDKYIFACDPDYLRDLLNLLVFEKESIDSECVRTALVAIGKEVYTGSHYNNFNHLFKGDFKNGKEVCNGVRRRYY